eukprot:jgi/Botrbrau1/12148/Bobra.0186s0060.1
MDGDNELDAIRQKRMAQLMSQYGQGQSAVSRQDTERQEEEEQAAEEIRQKMLINILQPAARDRLARIGLVKPEKATRIGNTLIQMAQQGRLFEKVSEQKLIDLLEQIDESAPKSKVTIQRRRPTWDE